MEPTEEIKKIWNSGVTRESDVLSYEAAEKMISARVKKERGTVFQYFWASLFFQIIVYAFSSHLIVKYWGTGLMVIGIVAIALYLPYTIILMRRFKTFARSVHLGDAASNDTYRHVQQMYDQLFSFFRFKRLFESISVPASAVLISATMISFYTSGPFRDHLIAAALLTIAIGALFIIAIRRENLKHFRHPLKQLRDILKDLETKTN